MNPARALGPPVVVGSFPGYFWIYFAGPFVGGLVAAAIYRRSFLEAISHMHASAIQCTIIFDFMPPILV